MHINLQAADHHAIQSYSSDAIQINAIKYESSLIVSREEIITDLAIKRIQEMDPEFLADVLRLNPEVILIGHEQSGQFPPMEIIQALGEKRIGFECMSIGAACRTFNVLLSEDRAVVAVFII